MRRFLFIIIVILFCSIDLSSQIRGTSRDCSGDAKCVLDKLTKNSWHMHGWDRYMSIFESSYEEVIFEFNRYNKLKISKIYSTQSGLVDVVGVFEFKLIKINRRQYGLRILEIDRCLTMEGVSTLAFNAPQVENCDFQEFVDVEFVYSPIDDSIRLIVPGREILESTNDFTFSSR